MKKISLFALSLLFLSGCYEYNGSWEVGEALTFKTKAGDVLVPATNDYYLGSINVKKNKVFLTFDAEKQIIVEIPIAKSNLKGDVDNFEITGSEIGQLYDFLGSKSTKYKYEYTQCESKCKDNFGHTTSCFPPEHHDCTITRSHTIVKLNLLDPKTKDNQAAFIASYSGKSITDGHSGPWPTPEK